MLGTIEIFIILCYLIATFVLQHVRRRRAHPPGPLGFPIFGMLPFQMFDMFISTSANNISDAEKHKLYKDKYGTIWSEEFGEQRMITLASRDLINEAFIENNELFSGRPTNAFYKLISDGKGISLTDGEMWRDNRQLAIRSLRELGMGRKALEEIISNEAADMIEYLERHCLGPVNITIGLTKGTTNVMTTLLFRERFRYDDTDLEKYVDNLRILAHSDKAGMKAILAPALFKTKLMRWLCPEVFDYLYASKYCCQFIREKCITRMNTFQADNTPSCVLDAFMRDRFTASSPLSQDEQNEEIIHSIYDLINGGIDTTSNILSFCCLMLGMHDHLQTELRDEIIDAFGDSGTITMDNRKRCPKILSFIDEVHRFCCVFPKVHHRVMQSCEFHGYKLHPDDIIFGDLVNLFTDPSLFKNPLQFDAYRFLDESKTTFIQSKYIIPFGIGKRSCPGKSIAAVESFIFLVSIIRRFRVTLPEETLCNFGRIMRGDSGIIHAPLHHMIKIDII